ncbi:pantetheine-phosphate adenylyltransferase [Pseudofrancisella aestuarii]|uniref:Phosphopantetheine adenylyltransferase n=1 Tax=Pseudofrancisella aestuarii TaxID=2670347 RepID=A0ABV9TCS0_9GAMM|nr:pantetheine-phosphate adenylyltransferase [Pseudofrancisella aestuarii]
MKQKIAIYPGTFDPITNGHFDLIKRGLCIFDKIIVAISTGYGKNTLFDLEDRKKLVETVFKNEDRVEVISFTGLLVDTAKKHNVCAILRGLRAVSDFDYEYQMSSINSKLDDSIQTVFLTPSESFSCISSTMVRAVAIHDYTRLKEFVPECVYDELKNKVQRG